MSSVHYTSFNITLVVYSEDMNTGLVQNNGGWNTKYVQCPKPLEIQTKSQPFCSDFQWFILESLRLELWPTIPKPNHWKSKLQNFRYSNVQYSNCGLCLMAECSVSWKASPNIFQFTEHLNDGHCYYWTLRCLLFEAYK